MESYERLLCRCGWNGEERVETFDSNFCVCKDGWHERYKGGPISSMYVMQDELTQLKVENALMKQRDQELTAKYDQVQRDNEEMKAQIALLMKQTGLTK